MHNAPVHANFVGRPLNYITDELFAQPQGLTPMELFVYSVMTWRITPFISAYKQKGYAFFAGKAGFFSVSRESAIIIKRKEDLKLAEFIIKAKKVGKAELEYDPLAMRAGEGIG